MKYKNKSIYGYLLCMLILASCSKSHFSYLGQNPNAPQTVPPYLLFTNITVSSFTLANAPDPGGASLRAHQTGNAQQPFVEQYWNWQQGDYTAIYNTLLQVHQMKFEAAKQNLPEYDGIAKFFDAYNFYKLTMLFGDVPYSQAEQAGNGVYNPKYDTQKSIFLGILNELDSANTELTPFSNANTGTPLTGDVIYGGSVVKWRQLINSFTLRVLIALSRKTGDADLNVIQRFQKIVGNPLTYPIMGSNNDDGALPYYNLNGNIYPLYKNTEVTRVYPDAAFCNFLTSHKDPRVIAFFSQTPNAIAAGQQPTDFTSYAGIDASATYGTASNLFTHSGTSSTLNIRYTANPAPEPHVTIGYPEQEFNLAEAAYRGWITDNPETHYKNGIQASMAFYEPYESLPANTYQTSSYFPVYYSNPDIAYKPQTALQQIIYQKYIAFFYNSFEEPYFNMRRTGYPVLTLNGGGMQNNGVLPLRFLYPISETQTNAAALNAAIQSQFGSTGDNINGVMWVLQ